MENKKGQPTTEAIFRGIQSGKVLELFDKLQYQIAIHGDLTYSDPWGKYTGSGINLKVRNTTRIHQRR